MGLIEDSLLNGVNQMIDKKLKDYKPKDYIEGKILAINTDGTCNVFYANETLINVPVRGGLSLSVGQMVLIKLINSDFSFKFIDLVRPW